MSTTTTTSKPQFRTICRIGHWLHVDAMWNAKQNDNGLTTNYIHYSLVDGHGDTMQIGFRIVETDTDTGEAVTDEDGDQFPDLETAMHSHVKEILTIDWQWTAWQDTPPMHRSASDGKATKAAFAARDVTFAVQLASRKD